MRTKELLEKHGIKLKKSLSQNFLSDERIARKIVEKSGIGKEDTVVEIGAGAGTLTEELARVAKRVIAYEIDERLKELLKERLSTFENVELIFTDFLKADLSKVPDGFVYVSNIPYGITGPIIEKILREGRFSFAVLMVQKEVAERITSPPGKRSYGYLSVLVQSFCDVEKLFDVSKSHFIPNPQVDSTVIKLVWKGRGVPFEEYRKFLSIAFSKKRKTLKNNLKEVLKDPVSFLKENGLGEKIRAEEVPPEVFLKLFSSLKTTPR